MSTQKISVIEYLWNRRSEKEASHLDPSIVELTLNP